MGDTNTIILLVSFCYEIAIWSCSFDDFSCQIISNMIPVVLGNKLDK